MDRRRARVRLCFRVDGIDFLLIAVCEITPAKLHAGCESAIGDAEFLGDNQNLFQLLVLRQIAIQFIDNALVQLLNLVRLNQLLARRELNAVVTRPSFQIFEAGMMSTAGKRRLSPSSAASATY